MHYSYEFKLMCVELYKEGKYPDIPAESLPARFKQNIRDWTRLAELHGPEILKPKVSRIQWTPDEKLALVSQVLAGTSRSKVALNAGINPAILYRWVQKYKTMGYNGLVTSRGRQSSKESNMKKSTNPSPLTESEREELFRLRAENKYIKTENEVIKKRIALRHERWAAQLKAKKQQSLENSVKKDTN